MDEWTRVLRTLDGENAARNRCLIVLGFTTGFRISELLSLTLRDVAKGRSLAPMIRVPKAAMKGKRHSRTVPLAPMAEAPLSEWLEALDAEDLLVGTLPLFLSRSGLKAISRQQAWRIITRAFSEAEIWGPRGSLATHTLRKTFAAQMHAQLHDVFKLQAVLGHASPASTAAYLSFQDEEAVEAVEAAFPSPKETPGNVLEFSR